MNRLIYVCLLVIALAVTTKARILNVPSEYSTIQAGINASVNGDTVLVAQGSYGEHLNYLGKLITLKSAGGAANTIISMTLQNSALVTFNHSENRNAKIDGFTFRGSTGKAIDCANAGPTIFNCIFENNITNGAVYCSGSSALISNCIFRNNTITAGNQEGAGIALLNSSTVVEFNIIYNNTAVYGGGINSRGSVADSIRYNLLYNNYGIGGIRINDSNQGFMFNNTVAGSSYSNPLWGIGIITQQVSNIKIRNNITYANSGYGIDYSWSTNSTESYDDSYGNGAANYNPAPGFGSLSSNPQFLNIPENNYHLQATSPCIDTGDPAFTYDPDCSRADMGAFYFRQRNLWYASTTGNDASGCGSLSSPFRTIQHGINVADQGDTVLALDGHYYERINFRGKKITVASQHLIDNDSLHIANTIIDGDTLVLGISDTASVARFVNREDSTSILRGFTITGGIGTIDNGIRQGGGIYCDSSSSPILAHCKIIHNANYGIYLHASDSPLSRNCVISENQRGGIASALGGIMGDSRASIEFDSCSILGNQGAGFKGSFHSSQTRFEYCSIIGNSATGIVQGRGGDYFYCIIQNNGGYGIAGWGGYDINSRFPLDEWSYSDSLIGCNVSNNGQLGYQMNDYASVICLYDTISANMSGGVSVCEDGILSMNNCLISDNKGSGIYATCDPSVYSIKLESCNFQNNIADRGGAIGGGIYFSEFPESPYLLEIKDCNFENNRARIGGAIDTYFRRKLIISGCSFIGNIADTGSAINLCSYEQSDSIPKINNSILSFNGPGKAFNCMGPVAPHVSCTDIFGNPGGDWVDCIASFANINGNFSVDPRFCDTTSEDLHLAANSPCLPENNSCGVLVGALGTGCDAITRTIHVAAVGNDTTGNGDLITPYKTIQHGINMSANGDTVLVQDGHYYERINFRGKGIIVASQHLIDNDSLHITNTIIDGDTLVLGKPDTGSVVCLVSGEDSTSILRGFTIQKGNGTVTSNGRRGGGIFSKSWNAPIISHCVIKENTNNGVYNGAILTLINCIISDNEGGGMLADSYSGGWYSHAYFDSCKIIANQGAGFSFTPDLGYGNRFSNCIVSENSGGGIMHGRSADYFNCRFENNGLYAIGGWYYGLLDEKPNYDIKIINEWPYSDSIIGCTFRGNEGAIFHIDAGLYCQADSFIDNQTSGFPLGAIHINGDYGDWAKIIDCYFADNIGSAISFSGYCDYIIIDSCSFIGNSAAKGGAICSEAIPYYGSGAERIFLNNCLFSGNQAQYGGAIFVSLRRDMMFNSCTFVNNNADTGSAIYLKSGDYYNYPRHIDKCLINSNYAGIPIYCEGSDSLRISCTNIFGNPGGDWVGCIDSFENINGNLSVNPYFCDTTAQDYTLRSNSTCLPENNSCGQLIGALGQGCIGYYNISAFAGSSGTIAPSGNVQVNYRGEQAFSIAPDTGYHVLDVLVDSVSIGPVTEYTFSNIIANHTISAYFAIDTFTITASADSNGVISPSGSVIVNYGSDTTLTIIPNTGYHVLDVLVDSVSMGPISSYQFSNVTSNHTINASFSIDVFSILATSGPNGSIDPSGATNINYGDSLIFTIRPDTGYHVLDVLVDSVSMGPITSYQFTNIAANHTISASFAINSYTITATAGLHGSITPAGQIPVSYGGSQAFAIVADSCYYVNDVFIDSVSIGPVAEYTFSNITANHTISASFAINVYSITANSGPNGAISPSGFVSINHGSDTTFTMIPDTGYHVFDVLVDGNVIGPVDSFTFNDVSANHNISVGFSMNTFMILATAGQHGTISPSGVVIVNYGTDTTFTITPDPDYHTADVLVDGATVGAAPTYTFNDVINGHVITASFTGLCDYIIGDVNNSGLFNGIDVSYSVGYFKGGPVPPYTCECNGSSWYVAGDVNGSCSFNGIDVSYMVGYFKGGSWSVPCPACPPALSLIPPAPTIDPIPPEIRNFDN